MSAGRKVPGLNDQWAPHQLDLLELADHHPELEAWAQEYDAAALEHGNETITEDR